MAAKFPLAVRAGRTIGAVSNVSVRLRRLVRPATAGTVAPAFALRRPRSRMLVWVPPKAVAPPKLFAWVSRRMSDPATVVARVVVPGTVIAPVCVMDPPAVTFRLPPAVSASVGSAIGAVSNVSVRLRRFVRPASEGMVAPALILRNPTSRILANVPPNKTALPRLLACVSSRRSDPATVVASVVVPPTAKAPD